MRGPLFALICVVLFGFAAGQPIKCGPVLSVYIKGETAVSGCDGSDLRTGNISWIISPSPSGKDRALTFAPIANCTPDHQFELWVQGPVDDEWDRMKILESCSHGVDNPLMIPARQVAMLVWTSSRATPARPKFTFELGKPADSYYQLRQGQDESVTGIQGAGYTQFGVSGTDGLWLNVSFEIVGYMGTRAPMLFINRHEFPKIGRAQYSNETGECHQVGVLGINCRVSYQIQAPTQGLWLFSIYTTGAFKQINSWLPAWQYAAKIVTSGQRVETKGRKSQLYAIQTTVRNVTMRIQLASLPPGGRTQLLIAKGYAPLKTSSDFIVYLSGSRKFDEVTIDNPFDPQAPNPGWFFLRLMPIDSNAASIFQVDLR